MLRGTKKLFREEVVTSMMRAGLVVAIVVVAWIVVTGRKQACIDVNSGRMRTQTILGGVVINEVQWDTEISEIWRHQNREIPDPEWEAVVESAIVFSRTRTEHHSYTHIPHAQRLLAITFEMTDVEPEVQSTIIENYFALLKMRQPGVAKQYCDKVRRLAVEVDEGTITATSAPQWVFSPTKVKW